MSPVHIAAMNELLHDAPDVRSACAQLRGPRVMSYTLTDGPDGAVVHWTISFTDTVQFALEEVPSPDVRLVGDWAQTIRAAIAAREGQQMDPGISIEDAGSVLSEIDDALQAAQAVTTVPVEFPPL